MADEQTQTQTPQEPATVTQTVTDEALSSAYDAAQTTTEQAQTETTQTTEQQTEQTATTETGQAEEHQEPIETEEHLEPTDNAERSRLGRRLKATEDKLDAILAKLEGQPGGQAQQQPAQVAENVTYDDTYIQNQIDAAIAEGKLPETIMTPHDQYRVNQFVNGLHQTMSNQYAFRYLNTLKAPVLKGNTPDDIHAEVIEELQKVDSPFNLRRYDNPTVDAQMNYLEAKASVLQKRLAGGKPTTVFRGRPEGSPATGTSVSTRTETVVDEMPALDEASQDFIKRTGMSVDSVKSALKGPMPFHLRGGLR